VLDVFDRRRAVIARHLEKRARLRAIALERVHGNSSDSLPAACSSARGAPHRKWRRSNSHDSSVSSMETCKKKA
jgi:hypothetical protein